MQKTLRAPLQCEHCGQPECLTVDANENVFTDFAKHSKVHMDCLPGGVNNPRLIAGPLTAGHYIQIGMGMGFYVPEPDFAAAQQRASQTRKVQFLGVTRAGLPLTGTREAILEHPDSAGLVAWIVPQ